MSLHCGLCWLGLGPEGLSLQAWGMAGLGASKIEATYNLSHLGQALESPYLSPVGGRCDQDSVVQPLGSEC